MIEFATQIPSQKLPRSSSSLAKLGLAYERKLLRALRESIPVGMHIYNNTWYKYVIDGEEKICSPDFEIVDLMNEYIIVGEIKLNWTPLAHQKLRELYCPVINICSPPGIVSKPLVIVKNLTPESPRPQPRLTWAFNAEVPLFHWTGIGSVLW